MRYLSLAIGLLLPLLYSCSSVQNLPEDEVLYRGIKKLHYGAQPKRNLDTQEGVITALADAYNKVEGLLSGDASVLQKNELTEEELRDSLKKANKQDEEAYSMARSEVEAVLSYAPNGAIMGSSYATHPFPIKLWIYNKYVGSKRRFGKWMFEHFASSPVYISTVNPKVRTNVAQNTLRNFGYFHSKVSYDTIALGKPKRAKLSYHVTPGVLFHLDSIAYQRFPHPADSIVKASSSQTLLKRGKPFQVLSLDGERNRLSKEFRDNGYFYYRPDYISYRADTLKVPEKVQLQVLPSPTCPQQAMIPYYIGNTKINIYKHNNLTLTDSLSFRNLTYSYNETNQKAPLRPGAILRYIYHRKGDLYKQDVQESIQEKLSAMGIFSSVRINYTPRDTTQGNDTLDVTINAMLDKPYDAEFQGKVTSKSNGQIGPGVNFSMKKYNAFRRAETLEFQAWGSYEWQTGANLEGSKSLINSYEYGLNASLTTPRILLFGLGKKIARRANSSTSFAIDAKWMNRANYFGRVSLGLSMKYTLQKRMNYKHEFTPFSLDYDILLNTTSRFESIVQENQALYVSMRNQFVPSMEYTFTWSNTSNTKPQTLKINLKEAGNVTSAIYAICRESFNKKEKTLFNVPFAQYIKASAQYTYKYPITKKSEIASRIFAGAIYSFGNALSAPYSDLFSIGGANSIRAFSAHSIGPGSYHPANSSYSYIDQMGDLKIEANIEYRFPIIAKLYGAAFIDAGNVWLLRENEKQPGGKFNFSDLGKNIALGTGAGLRYDLDFLVLRVDVGIGIHAPYDTGKNGYYNMTSFGKSLGYHFAIGYPF